MGGGTESPSISNISIRIPGDPRRTTKVLVVSHEKSKSGFLQVKPITETEVTPLETEKVDLQIVRIRW